MNKKIGYIIAAIVAIVLIALYAQSMSNKPADNSQVTTQPTQQVTATATPEATNEQTGPEPIMPEGLTAAEVAKHNTTADCYASVGDKVYDLTAWIKKHPGGEQAIIGLCGTDATAKFTKQHGSSANAQAALSSLFIADLNK